jgi:hypothetical protein
MSLRDFLRRWMRPASRALPDAQAALPAHLSLEALMSRPAVEPDVTGYSRPGVKTNDEAARWLYGDRDRGFWDTEPSVVRNVAVYWLGMREIATGVRVS